MENMSKVRWALVIILVIALLIGATIGIASIARNIFGGNRSESETRQSEQVEAEKLTEMNRPNVQVVMEVQGPIVAKEEYQIYRLTVSRTERKMQIITGYDGQITAEKRYPNTEAAFGELLSALDREGFDANRESSAENPDDESGACPTGKRYIYLVEENGVEVQRTWNASCSRKLGTSTASSAVRRILTRQFPDFSEFTRDMNFR